MIFLFDQQKNQTVWNNAMFYEQKLAGFQPIPYLCDDSWIFFYSLSEKAF